jgi:very-short-patch-repair endonuclease
MLAGGEAANVTPPRCTGAMHEQELLALAARQYGLAHRKQITSLGLGPSAIRHLTDTGRWHWRSGHVLQLTGAPATADQDAMLAVLDLNHEGAALSYQTSAAMWGLPGFATRPFHVVGHRMRGRNHDHLGIIHQPRLLLPDHIMTLRGIPTVSPTLTLFQLAATLRWPQQVERALDNALTSGLTSIVLMNRALKRLARRGRPGIALMRGLLDARPPGYVPTATNLEARFEHVAHRAGHWGFVRQVNVGDEYDWIGRVDFVDRDKKIIVEVQSSRFHGGLVDQLRDAQRIAALRAAGWTVIEVLEHDLWHNPDKVIAQLRAANW